MDDAFQPLIVRIAQTTGVDSARARRVVEDVLAFLDEDLTGFVQRRHRELAREGMRNEAIYVQVAREIGTRRFAVAAPSVRRIRRLIYG